MSNVFLVRCEACRKDVPVDETVEYKLCQCFYRVTCRACVALFDALGEDPPRAFVTNDGEIVWRVKP